MSFLGNEEILKRFDELFTDGDPDCVREASYDLRLGRELYVVGEDVPKRLTRVKPYAVLRPNGLKIRQRPSSRLSSSASEMRGLFSGSCSSSV